MTTQPRSEAPTRVGDYTVLTRLGEGGMGIVHLARHPDGRRVALKVLRPQIVGDDEARARLAREVSSLQRVRSTWVAEIIDADPWAEIPYVVTRYVPGLSLHHHIHEEGPITGEDLTWLAACLADGISAVHEAGVLHRDVKPSNVLMEGRTPILIDFGLARVADDQRLTQTGWLLGTPGYLAPEVLYGDEPTPAVDVHAWGGTVAWAATGRAPYGKGPSMAVMDRTRRGQHDLAGMTGPLAEVVAAALDPDPLARPLFREILDWLRPLTTRPELPRVAPPASGADPAADDYTLPLAIANSAASPTATPVTEVGTASTVAEPGPRPTLVMPVSGALPAPSAAAPSAPTLAPRVVVPRSAAPTERQLAPPAPAMPLGAAALSGTAGSAGPPPPDAAAMGELEQAWDARYLAPAPVPWLERCRRATLIGLTGLVIGTLVAVAPYVTGLAILATVWALRTGSLAASATAERRTLNGRKWYDAPRFLLTTPWHLLRGITGTLLLVLWSAGLGLAAALICYAVHLGVVDTLLVSGTVLGVALWSGPGSGRFRRPLSRIINPAAARPLLWLVWCGALVAVAIALAVVVTVDGVFWVPASSGPFGIIG